MNAPEERRRPHFPALGRDGKPPKPTRARERSSSSSSPPRPHVRARPLRRRRVPRHAPPRQRERPRVVALREPRFSRGGEARGEPPDVARLRRVPAGEREESAGVHAAHHRDLTTAVHRGEEGDRLDRPQGAAARPRAPRRVPGSDEETPRGSRRVRSSSAPQRATFPRGAFRSLAVRRVRQGRRRRGRPRVRLLSEDESVLHVVPAGRRRRDCLRVLQYVRVFIPRSGRIRR